MVMVATCRLPFLKKLVIATLIALFLVFFRVQEEDRQLQAHLPAFQVLRQPGESQGLHRSRGIPVQQAQYANQSLLVSLDCEAVSNGEDLLVPRGGCTLQLAEGVQG